MGSHKRSKRKSKKKNKKVNFDLKVDKDRKNEEPICQDIDNDGIDQENEDPGKGYDDEIKYEKKQEEKRIKTDLVIFKRTIHIFGNLEIDAPIGVGIDKETGNLTKPVHLEPFGEIVLKPKVLKDKLINEGFISARLIVDDNDPEPCPDIRKGNVKQVFIPAQSVLEIKGIKSEDDVHEYIKIESLSVFGLPDINQNAVKLFLNVILEVKLIITRECIIEILCNICELDSE